MAEMGPSPEYIHIVYSMSLGLMGSGDSYSTVGQEFNGSYPSAVHRLGKNAASPGTSSSATWNWVRSPSEILFKVNGRLITLSHKIINRRLQRMITLSIHMERRCLKYLTKSTNLFPL
jgi:hypothetical protein